MAKGLGLLSGERSDARTACCNAQSSEVISAESSFRRRHGRFCGRWCSCETKGCQTAEPGRVVSHVVAVSWDERHLVAVAKVALVFGLDLAQVGRQAAGGGPAVVQDSVGVLSVRLATVTSLKSRSRFMTSTAQSALARGRCCSRTLGFSNVTKLAQIQSRTVGARRQGRGLR
jgi:hypothetical protein